MLNLFITDSFRFGKGYSTFRHPFGSAGDAATLSRKMPPGIICPSDSLFPNANELILAVKNLVLFFPNASSTGTANSANMIVCWSNGQCLIRVVLQCVTRRTIQFLLHFRQICKQLTFTMDIPLRICV